jgi:hypothetical protein
LRLCASMINRELRVTLTPVPRPDKWVFVVGCYNSGTTLLAEMLGAHRQVGALPTEGQFLTDELVSDHRRGLPRMWSLREDLYRLTENDVGPDATRMKKEWAMRLDRSKRVLLEKTPGNGARMRWLQKHFENAHFIAIIRNGYAAAEGIRRKAQPVYPATGWTIEQCAHQWRRSNEVIQEDAPHLRRFMWVRYEDLTDDPQRTLAPVLDFLELSDMSGIDLQRQWSVHERSETIKNMNAASIKKLSPQDIDTIEAVAGETLIRFGYELLSKAPAVR